MNIESHFEPDAPADVLAKPSYLFAGLEPLRSFADRVAEVEALLGQLEELTGSATTRAVTRLKSELDSFEPAVTFLGQVKSGKTTLVNAMAGWADLLPADVNPWTSVITSLHLKPGHEKKDLGARFRFMDEGEWDRLVHKGGRLGELANRAGSENELQEIRAQIETLREKSRRRLGRKFELLLGQEHDYGYFDEALLERYICIGDDFADDDPAEGAASQGRFADITRSADLFLTADNSVFRMCLRDTPGVNDTFMMREQVTINAIRSSRICVVVLSAHQALTSVDMALIRMISSLQSRDVAIFVNRIDELSDPAGQVPEIEASIRKVLAEHKGPDDAQIVFGSAKWASQALSDEADCMEQKNNDALMNWSVAQSDHHPSGMTLPETAWRLSGLPELNRIVSERVVEKLGAPLLDKITTSAISVAGGQQAANKIRVEGDVAPASMCLQGVKTELTELAKRHREELLAETDEIIRGFQERSERANTTFVAQATKNLIAHLDAKGAAKVWNANPTTLRVLLKSAYSVFATRARSSAKKRYEAAVVDIAGLYFRAFGKAVEGIELSVPEVRDFPAPVAIAQTIALDFNDSWWTSWWRRTRGVKAFAKQFQALVSAETKDVMTQLQTVQTRTIQDQLTETLDAFFEQNKDIMIEISTSRNGSDGLQQMCLGAEESNRLARIESIITTLRHHAGQSLLEAGQNGTA